MKNPTEGTEDIMREILYGASPVAMKAFHRVLETLTSKEQEIIRSRYLEAQKPLQRDIARKFNVSPQTISRIERKALRKLAHPVRVKKLEEEIDAIIEEEHSTYILQVQELVETAPKLTPYLISHLKNNTQDLQKIPPDIFEHLIAEFFASWGYEDVRVVGTDPRTAADVYVLSKPDASGVQVRLFIEVKRWKDRVGIEVVNKVYGALLMEQDKYGWHLGMVVALGGYKKFRSIPSHAMQRMGIELRDSDNVIKWLNDYEPRDGGLWLPNPIRKMPKGDVYV